MSASEDATNEADAAPEPVLHLRSLAPNFDASEHKLYVDMLRDAIDNKNDVRNIALTGAYGTGKSSILANLREFYGKRLVELSLSTAGEDPDSTEQDTTANPAATTKTNRIQKEIVKQLLYQEAPDEVRGSRFNRLSPRHVRREVGAAAAVAVIAFAVLYFTALGEPFGGSAEGDFIPRLVASTVIAVVVGVLCFALRAFAHNRLFLEKVSAGPATVSLAKEATSYFDQYLDEIVYYFEITKRDIVIFEDIDRFNDIHIFDTLRALNVLLNGTHHQGDRKIRFIYALRDSVFEHLGQDDDSSTAMDGVERDSKRANRTKFFDLVIPVVPFITHRNARDLMGRAMKSDDFTIDRELIGIAAQHVADMRLITNIRNEYLIFRHKLLRVEHPLPGLTDDLLFAMVLYKNAHMSDFEAIRIGTSKLDTLYDQCRSLVDHNIKKLSDELVRNKGRLASIDAIGGRSETLGDKLITHIDLLRNTHTYGPASAGDIVLEDGTSASSTTIRTPAFWRKVIVDKQAVTIDPHPNYGSYTYAPDDLEVALSEKFDPDSWADRDEQVLRNELERITFEIETLRYATWQQLYSSTLRPDSERQTFRQLVETTLDSELGRDLIARGFINDYFSLYVSAYYGEHVRPDAMNYIVHSIDRGTPSYSTPLQGADVDAILSEKGPGVMRDPSMYNISIVNHLLETHPDHAQTIAHQLAVWGEREQEFIGAYLTQGSSPEQLVELMTPTWREAFSYLVPKAPVDEQQRLALMNRALTHWTDRRLHELDDSVHEYLEAHYAELDVLVNEEALGADRAVQMMSWTGVAVQSVAPLSKPARLSVTRHGAYLVTEENLSTLAGTDNLALDNLLKRSQPVFEVVAAHLKRYLGALETSANTTYSIDSSENFVSVINAIPEGQPEELRELVVRSSPDCMINDISSIVPANRAAVVAASRVTPTFENISTYLSRTKKVDDALAALLISAGTIQEIEDVEASERLGLALSIVSAREVLDPEIRATLAGSLDIDGYLPLEQLEPESGKLMGELLAHGLVEDDATVFNSSRMTDWPTREHAMASSKALPEFLTPDLIPRGDLSHFMESSGVSDAAKRLVVNNLAAYLADRPAAGIEAVGAYVFRHRIELTHGQLEALRGLGLSQQSLINLIATAQHSIDITELRALLRAMGGDYETVADPGHKRPLFSDDNAHRRVFERLIEAEIVSKVDDEDSKQIRVTLKHG